MSGWIKLHRQIVTSSKFADADILRLWIMCLTKAAHKEQTVIVERQEIKLKPGQFVTGRFALSHDYNNLLSKNKRIKDTTLWNWLKRLESWGDIDIKSTNKYSVVTVLKWDEYQEDLTTNQQQTDSKLITNWQQNDTNKNEKNEKNEKNDKEEKDIGPPDGSPTRKRFKPPTFEEVQAYCRERQNNIDAQKWIDYYASNGWKVGRNPMKDWKAAVRTWERSDYSKGGAKNAVHGRSVEDPYAGIDFGF